MHVWYEGTDFKTVQKEVSDLLIGRILVGHAVHHDLKVRILLNARSVWFAVSMKEDMPKFVSSAGRLNLCNKCAPLD